MSTMNISLPEPLRDWVEEQVKSGSFGNASEYIRSLIRDDQKQRAQHELEAKLLEGIESGPATPWTPQDSEAIRTRLLGRTAQADDKDP
jgi:antitoxin ParD1/3/4